MCRRRTRRPRAWQPRCTEPWRFLQAASSAKATSSKSQAARTGRGAPQEWVGKPPLRSFCSSTKYEKAWASKHMGKGAQGHLGARNIDTSVAGARRNVTWNEARLRSSFPATPARQPGRKPAKWPLGFILVSFSTQSGEGFLLASVSIPKTYILECLAVGLFEARSTVVPNSAIATGQQRI